MAGLELGFETIGNATLIIHDKGPILVTDPWIDGPAYFGAWSFSHEIPAEQRASIAAAKYVWISHGHPDHLSSQSLAGMSDKTILLPDHVGGRIKKSLEEKGFSVRVLKDRTWIPLSDRVRVLCIADYNQDGILLVDLDGTLVVNLNDASDRGWGRFVKREVSKFKKAVLMRLSGYGDADMIHCFDESGRPIPPVAARKFPPGRQIQEMTEQLGCRYFVPFSSMHVWQRADTVWADRYVTGLADYSKGFESRRAELLPAFQRYDALCDSFESIDPAEKPRTIFPPEAFGDDWDEPLTKDDEKELEAYIRSFEHLKDCYDFIAFHVGGRELMISLAEKKFQRGISFQAPRGSLMKSVSWRVFDDMLIGNFMKTTLHGNPGSRPLYPDFTPYVAKYGDNGQARSRAELAAYFEEYRRRAPIEHLFHALESKAVDAVRGIVSMDSPLYGAAKKAYRVLKS